MEDDSNNSGAEPAPSPSPNSAQLSTTKPRRVLGRRAVTVIGIVLALWTAALIYMEPLVAFVEAQLKARPPAPRELDPNYTPDQIDMYTFTELGGEPARAVVASVVERKDKRFVPVFVEMLYANEHAPLLIGAGAHRHVMGLRQLTGVNVRADLNDGERISEKWFAWYATTRDIRPPDGFVGWKGRILARVDSAYGEILTDKAPLRIRAEEILYSGRKLNQIPALDEPRTLPAAEASGMRPDEPVFGIVVEGQPRAYPQRMLEWHEIVNDTLGNLPVSITYCMLCGAPIAYRAGTSAADRHVFGSSGLVYRSNKLLYDRKTRTLWSQFTGEAVLGSLAANRNTLARIPLQVTTWADWTRQYPQTTVLSDETEYAQHYRPSPRRSVYLASNEIMFPMGIRSDRLPAKEYVLGLNVGNAAKAYPFEGVRDAGIVNDSAGGTPLAIIATQGPIIVDGVRFRRSTNGAFAREQYNAGVNMAAYARGTHTFRKGESEDSLVDETGRPWKVTAEALIGPDGQIAPRVDGLHAYWFAWYAFHEQTDVYRTN